MVRTGAYATTWTSHNLLRTVGDMFGAAPSGAAGICRPIVGVFTTDPVPVIATFRRGEGGYSGAAASAIAALSTRNTKGHASQEELTKAG